MKQTFLIIAALLAGFVGGILGTRVGRARQQNSQQVIRARSFELVNEAGQVLSFWGVDKGQNIVLTFGSRGPFRGSALLPGRPPGDLEDPHKQVTAIGLQGDDMPLMKMSGADGKTRVRLLLSPDGKPTLSMEDETGPRVSLGIEQSDTPGPDDNDWSLVFRPEVARIGLHAEKHQGQTYVQGGVFVSKDKIKYP
jgi:hypothetical protein